MRAVHHLLGGFAELWILLVADDFKIESTAPRPQEQILAALWALVLLGIPLQWTKVHGGRELNWVGYHLLLSEHALGISESRATWLVSWCLRLAHAGMARIGELQ